MSREASVPCDLLTDGAERRIHKKEDEELTTKWRVFPSMDYHQISEQDPLLASLTRHTNPSQSQMETFRAGLSLRIYWNAI